MAYNLDFQTVPVQEVALALGEELESFRLAKNITQADLADVAGVSLRTITRLEKGEGVSLDTFIRVLRALGIADNLANLIPDTTVWPVSRVRTGGRPRQRARNPTKKQEKTSEWAWGQEPDKQ